MNKQFLTFIKKEFAHVLRDRKTLLVLFGLPIVQILIFGFALTNEVKNSKILIVDNAKDVTSIQIIEKIEASRYFDVEKRILNQGQIESVFQEGKIKIALIIPENFNHDLYHTNAATVRIIADASDSNIANTLTNYLSVVIQDYGSTLTGPLFRQAQYKLSSGSVSIPRIVAQTRMLYNPQLKGVHNFVPGVMALVLMLVCVMMTAISIVREKETGTMEILLVSPFKPILVIFSKAIPYLLLSLVNVVTILLLSVYVLDLPINGSILLLFIESILFIITCLSIGILISVKTASQQTAMLISMMGMMLPTILFSGFMFPIENMPLPLQIISNAIPSKWYYVIVKSIMIKGLGFHAIWKETLILFSMTVFLIIVSLKSFKIRLA